MKHKITIWDNNSQRLMRLEATLRIVMKKMNIKADVQLNSEIPLLQRHGLHAKVPTIQIDNGEFWTHEIDAEINTETFENLFRMLQKQKLL